MNHTHTVRGQDGGDRLVLVTGATGGIGRAAVARFVDDGWKVVATDLPARADFDAYAGSVRYVPADVTDPDAIESVVSVAEEIGTLKACVANAGVVAEEFQFFLDAPQSAWRKTIDVNVLGTMNTLRAAARAMAQRGSGSLVATSSVAGVKAEPGLPAYCASKAAIVSIVKSLAAELGSIGLQVNAVAPGPVATDLQKKVIEERNRKGSDAPETAADRFERHRNEGRAFERMATPEEVAGVFSWLTSPAAEYITGQVIVIDGGGVLV